MRSAALIRWIRAALPYLALAAIVVGSLNFLWFMTESQALGGSAQNGLIRDGRYFVGEHGRYTEVSREAWEWSRVHGISVLITHPLAIAGMAYLLLTRIVPAAAGLAIGSSRSGPSSVARARDVQQSGRLMFGVQTGAQIGSLTMSSSDVLVYPAGIIIKPPFMPWAAIRGEEIQVLETARGLMGGMRLRILHASPDLESPLVLFTDPGGPLGLAIRRVADVDVPADDVERGGPVGDAEHDRRPDRDVPLVTRLVVVTALALSVLFTLWALVIFEAPPGPFGLLWRLGVIASCAYGLWFFAVRGRGRWL